MGKKNAIRKNKNVRVAGGGLTGIATNEMCRVRKDAVGIDNKNRKRPDTAYTLAIVKRKYRNTARILLITDTNEVGNTLYSVSLNALWKLKKVTRQKLHFRMNKATLRRWLFDDGAVDGAVDGLLWKPIDAKIDGLNCVYEAKTPNDTLVTIVHGSVTDFKGDAIVNAANTGCLGGGGIDGRINDLGGHLLHQARLALPVLKETELSYKVRCNVGDAKITTSGNLPCEHVIHAVGPAFGFSNFEADLDLLRDAYKSALRCAQDKKLSKIAFCILSAGIFRGGCSLRTVIETGIKAIAENTYPGLQRVFFCGFTQEEKATFSAIIADDD